MFRNTGMPLLASGFLLGSTLLGSHPARNSGIEPAAVTAGAATVQPTVRILQFQCLARAAAEARVPALERGGLKSIDILPGTHVSQGKQLAALDDREAVLTVQLAERELLAARQKLESSRKVQIAEAAVEEGRQQLEEAEEQATAAELLAADESPVQLARKLEELAEDKLERARVSREQSERSVPAAEWFALQNEWDQSRIRTEAATQERSMSASRSRAARSLVEQQRAALQRLDLQLEEAQSDREDAKLQLQNLQTTLDIAQARLDRRRLTAPFDGVVVEHLKQAGEWCEAGEAVVRVLQLDPLHLEGFASADVAASLKTGQKVRGQVLTPAASAKTDNTAENNNFPPLMLEGRLIFISPEVDALNRQVRIRAEVANPEFRLRPGENVLLNVLLEN
ncbi:MAG: HlyD family efflux transporter periplasmic adaptor subunit [Planctomycetaceae bacterium]